MTPSDPPLVHTRRPVLGLSAMVLLVCLGAGGARAQAVTTPAPALDAGYALGPGDKVRVTVFGEPALTGEFVVSGQGKVALPLVGEVRAEALSVPAFQKEVQVALQQGYLKDPKVSVEVLTYRPYYILGEVNKPGEYPYSSGLNVLNAVATAGGFTYRAQSKKVMIRRKADPTERSYPMQADVMVMPGDTIRIRERLF